MNIATDKLSIGPATENIARATLPSAEIDAPSASAPGAVTVEATTHYDP